MIVLASASPRRRQLLSRLGVDFTVVPSGVLERGQFPGERPEAYARALARQKARDVAARHPDAVVLAADTVVALHGRSLGKPSNAEDACRMLDLLRGNTHLVLTAVAVRCGEREEVDTGQADVSLRAFSGAEAKAYVSTGEPMDKAGAYAIQGEGGRLIQAVSGCYNAVVGLPLCVTAELLRRCGVEVLETACRHHSPEVDAIDN